MAKLKPWHGFAVVGVIAALVLAYFLTPTPPANQLVWEQVLEECSQTQVGGNAVLFFGFSNMIGPGSIWRKSDPNGYVPVRPLPDNDTAGILVRGQDTSCQGQTKTFDSASVTASITELERLVPGEAKLSLRRAKNVTLSTPAFAWDQLYEGRFEDMVDRLPADDGFVVSLVESGLVIGRALRVNGYEAVVELGGADAAQVVAKYAGTAEGGVSFSRVSDTSLKMSGGAPAYVAVQMWEWGSGGFAASAAGGTPLQLDAGARAVTDTILGG